METSTPSSTGPPVLIIGAGISGLLLAQHLRRRAIPFRIFDRDADFSTRGVGWGLTLHWSLTALRELLPEHLVERIPTTYVDRQAVESGAFTTFPLYDLSNGDLKAATPKAPEAQRIRVSRQKLRRLLAEGVDIEWGKAFSSFEEALNRQSVTARFEDGQEVYGSLLVACDGGSSRVRKALLPDCYENYRLPVRVLGFKAAYSPEEIATIKQLDPFFLQATSSQNDTFMYFSVLDAPGNYETGMNASNGPGPSTTTNSHVEAGKYTCQVVISWPFRHGFFTNAAGLPDFPSTLEGKIKLIRSFADTWVEPFRSIALGVVSVPHELRQLELSDYVPPKNLKTSGRIVLMGDAFHAMTMYRGEGANHAIVDVLDFAKVVTPRLKGDASKLRVALDEYEAGVVNRTRPAVLAARQACLDAHDWPSITPSSPLLTKREMYMTYDEDDS